MSALNSTTEYWQVTTIGQIADVYDGPHATPKKATRGPIFLGISNLVDGRIDLSSTEHLSEEDYLRWTRRIEPTTGDVVFSYETRLGEAALVPEGLRCCLGRRMGLLRAKKDLVVPEYLRYAYLGPEFQEVIRQRTVHGSTVDRIPLIEMPNFPIRLPPLPEQRAIASILGALDDKIELNRRMNRTLEAMARALFQSWFVDFDPVRAKAAGQEPGLPAEIADLFPDRLVESEVGEIPEGWGIGTVLDVANLLSGGTPATSIDAYWDGNIPWVSAKDVSAAQGQFVLDTERKVSQLGIENSSTKILPKLTTIVTARGTVGKYCLLGRDMAMNQTNYGLRAKSSFSHYAVFFCLGNMIEQLKQQAYGTIFDTITTTTFKNTRIVVPHFELHTCFDSYVEPLMHRMLSNQEETMLLSNLRDALLPKLISGELRVPEAEALIEEAGT